MKLKTFAKRAAAAGAVAAALLLTALPALAAPAVDVDAKNPVADHANILSADTEEYIYAISSQLSDACGAQIGVYTVEEALGNTTMEGFAYNVFTAWELGSADQDNGVLLLLAPYEADGGDYYDDELPPETWQEETQPEDNTIVPGTPFTEDGIAATRDLLYDKHTNKQFITVETRNGHTLYIVIDYDKLLDEEEERYPAVILPRYVRR